MGQLISMDNNDWDDEIGHGSDCYGKYCDGLQ